MYTTYIVLRIVCTIDPIQYQVQNWIEYTYVSMSGSVQASGSVYGAGYAWNGFAVSMRLPVSMISAASTPCHISHTSMRRNEVCGVHVDTYAYTIYGF